MYSIEFSPRAEKAFRKLERRTQIALTEKIDLLATSPRGSQTQKLSGGHEMYRLRVGAYRIIYAISDRKLIVLILDVGHRKDIYRGL